MRDFLADCVGSAPFEQADRIREATLLLPHASAFSFGQPHTGGEAQAIEWMLESGAYESAVLALIGPETAFMLSRGGSGSCLATVVLPDGSEEMIAEGSTLALALLAGHVSALIADSEQEETSAPGISPVARMHLN